MKRTTDEIQREADRLLEGTIEHLAQKIGLRVLPNQRKTEIGIDFTFEILDRVKSPEVKTYGTFYLQNKGTDDAVTVLRKGPNTGSISFQLDGSGHIEYFCLAVDQPIVIMLCDLPNKTIFWLPIQLHTERYVQELRRIKNELANNERKTDSIQIYFNPAKFILKDGIVDEQNFNLFLDDIKASKEYLVNRYKSKSSHYYKGQRPLKGLTIERNHNIVDQVHAYVNFRFKELNFVPVDFLIHHYPIEATDGATASHFHGFVLRPGNKALVSVFEKTQFRDGVLQDGYPEEFKQVVDLEKKLKEITRQFRRLGILYIEDNRQKYIDVPHADMGKVCSCSRCLFNKLMFAKALNSTQDTQTEITKMLKQAYVLYKFGHFIRAVEIVDECAILSSESRQYEWYFISKYNLAKLGISIAHFAWGDQKLEKQAKDLRAIDLDEIVRLHTDTPNHEFLEGLSTNRFFSDANVKISSLSTKIREHYFSQLRGGSASNNYVWELLSEFDQVQSVFHENYIAFEGFSDFGILFEKVVEGTFASHAMSESQSSRMESFSENLITHFIHYGDPDFIIKLFKRYELKELNYSAEPSSPYYFTNLVQNFFNELPQIKDELDYTTNLYFRQRCNKMFATLMALSGMLKLDTESLQTIYKSLVSFLPTGIIDNQHFLQYVQYFIARRGKSLNTDTTKELLYLAYGNFDFYGSSIVETLASQLVVTKTSLTNDEFNRVVQLIETPDEDQDEKIYISLVYLFVVCDPVSQGQIKEIISARLDKNFDGQLYYLAAIHDVIPIKEEQFGVFVSNSKLRENQVSWSSLMGSTNKRFPHVGALFNLAFKLGKNTSSPEFQDFKGIDPYYDWLMDMENFDYSKFDANWVKEYDTIYYIDEMKKHPKVRAHVLAYLRENTDKHLQSYFFKRLME